MEAERTALSHLIYFSRLDLPAEARERSDILGEIARQARTRNEACDITSVLLIDSAFAAQVLEGDGSKIHETFQRIAVDARHRDVLIIEWRHIPRRVFDTACRLVCRSAGNEHLFARAGFAAILQSGTPKARAVLDLATALAGGPGGLEPGEPTLL